MKFVKLETKEQILALEEGDLIITLWRNEDIKIFNVAGILNNEELLLDIKEGAYLIIDLYLNGTSRCKEAWLVTKGD